MIVTAEEPIIEEREPDTTGSFSVLIYTDDGRLVNEYSLDPLRDKVPSLRDAEDTVRRHMVGKDLGGTIIVVSQEILNQIRQVQITLSDDVK